MNFKEQYIKTKQREFYIKNYQNKKQMSNELKKRYTDIIFKIIHNQNIRIKRIFEEKGIERSMQYRKYLNCKPDELKTHLANKFTEGMTYDNYGEWEVDHIIPISSFNLHDIDEAKKCFNFNNLQPLWKEDNMKKSNKLNFEKH